MMNQKILLLISGLIIFALGFYLRIVGYADSEAYITTGVYLTIVWLINSSLSQGKVIRKMHREIEELKNK